MIVVEQQQESAGARVVEDVVDKKKKRRSSRRPRQNPSLTGLVEATGQLQVTSQNSLNCDTSRNDYGLKQHFPNKVSNVAFTSLPTMHMNDSRAKFENSMKVYSSSCPYPYGDDLNFVQPYIVDGFNKQKRFDPHWPIDAVYEGLQKSEIFPSTLRVNAHNRLEAYCTIEGVPTDVLITGIPLQNRTVEGDVVAVKLDPPLLWGKMKGLTANNSSPTDDGALLGDIEVTHDNSKGKDKVDAEHGYLPATSSLPMGESGFYDGSISYSDVAVYQESTRRMNYHHGNRQHHSGLHRFHEGCSNVDSVVIDSVEKLSQVVISCPSKRPTGRVVAIIEPSRRRDAIVGFLNVKWPLSSRENSKKENRRNTNFRPFSNSDYIHFAPIDPKLPKMIVPVGSLPGDIRQRLDDGDPSIEGDLVAARIDCWTEESFFPQACVMYSFGRGGEVGPRIASILFENEICSSEFSVDSLSFLPNELWQVPQAELECRKDVRDLCVFTIDPSTATDLDDALSVERLSNGVYRVGVHIADVSYFVKPDTALDMEAQVRSTSVYMLRSKLPMLPSLLSENMGSLIPGVDRLAFTVFWDLNASGTILDRWVGHTVIRSCCKMSYENAQEIIDGHVDADRVNSDGNGFPQLYGSSNWDDVFQSVRYLHDISKVLKEKRFDDGALRLESAKVVFLLDEFGVPYDSMLSERTNSNFVVEEFMLLANRTAAEIIVRAFPDSALLRRHPEPNARKLRELEAFCSKNGFKLDSSSSGSLHQSLEKIREKLKNDAVLYDILINYATKPMQLAKYFCSGDVNVGEDDRGHYALAIPLYTHFTSPLRRYPDIVVHRTLTAAIEVEHAFLKHNSRANKVSQAGDTRCFTGMNFDMNFDMNFVQTVEGQQALSSAALKHKLPSADALSSVALYCNKKKLASRHVKDAIDKLYMWRLLKNREVLLSEARVLGIGPRFMSIYVQKLAIERRIYYDDVDGLIVDWLEATSTLVLSYVQNKRCLRKGNPGKYKALDEVVLINSPCNMEPPDDVDPTQNVNSLCDTNIDPSVFPFTIRVLSTIPVALHAVGGDDGPLDIAARFFASSYFR